MLLACCVLQCAKQLTVSDLEFLNASLVLTCARKQTCVSYHFDCVAVMYAVLVVVPLTARFLGTCARACMPCLQVPSAGALPQSRPAGRQWCVVFGRHVRVGLPPPPPFPPRRPAASAGVGVLLMAFAPRLSCAGAKFRALRDSLWYFIMLLDSDRTVSSQLAAGETPPVPHGRHGGGGATSRSREEATKALYNRLGIMHLKFLEAYTSRVDGWPALATTAVIISKAVSLPATPQAGGSGGAGGPGGPSGPSGPSGAGGGSGDGGSGGGGGGGGGPPSAVSTLHSTLHSIVLFPFHTCTLCVLL
jgi:uncharacterized membrane protein YgcG